MKSYLGEVQTNDLFVEGKKVYEILGIPYARVNSRFDMPKIIEKYSSKIINYGKGVRFPQKDVPPLLNVFMKNPMMRPEILTNKDETREDAFVVNIWTTDLDEKKPVFVFIHGGGFTYGSGTTPLYNGKYLASKDIVVVTINYRLGVTGFLPLEIDGELSANRGFYDQQCALKWIRRNIKYFGGDENNITLAGQSAGGLSVYTHMLNKESSKYFDKLIVMSAGAPKCFDKETALKASKDFFNKYKIKNIQQLEDMPYKKLVNLQVPLGVGSSPTIDGKLFDKQAYDILKNGEYDPKLVIISSTDDELKMIDNKSWYKPLGIVNNYDALKTKADTRYGPDGMRLLNDLRSEAKSVEELQFKLMELVMFHSSALRSLNEFSKTNSAFGLRFGCVPNAWNGLRGAYHCSELPFVFGTIKDMNYQMTDLAMKQVKLVQKDIIEFVKSGVVSGLDSFNLTKEIIRYKDDKRIITEFPQLNIIEETIDGDLYDVIQKDFMNGRDNNFIA